MPASFGSGMRALLDDEHRTACRRLLADVDAGDPAMDGPKRDAVGVHLGTSRYLVAAKREHIIDLRERSR